MRSEITLKFKEGIAFIQSNVIDTLCRLVSYSLDVRTTEESTITVTSQVIVPSLLTYHPRLHPTLVTNDSCHVSDLAPVMDLPYPTQPTTLQKRYTIHSMLTHVIYSLVIIIYQHLIIALYQFCPLIQFLRPQMKQFLILDGGKL